MEADRILIVVAHPDDEVLGCFGTVAKMIKNGMNAWTLILGEGKTSRGLVDKNVISELRKEAVAANCSIGIRETFFCDFPDNAFDSVPMLSIVKCIEKTKNQIQPNIIFTHHYGDCNIDHQLTHKAVITATRPMVSETVKKIYSMEIPSSTEWNSYNLLNVFVPNYFVNISETIEDKILAMEKYRSELCDYPHPRSLRHIKELARVNGIKVGLKYSENFMLVREIR